MLVYASLIEAVNAIYKVVIEINKLRDSKEAFKFALTKEGITLLLIYTY